MHMFHSGMMAWLVTVQLFCCGMDGQFVAVRTRADKKNSLLKKENIKESLVLAVLYAHQKKTTPYIITIPQVSRQNDILERDITILNDLIDKRDNELKFYVQNLSYNEQINCVHATDVLGAQKQLVRIINCLFSGDIINYIGSKMISSDVQEYVTKQLIEKGTVYLKNVDINNCSFDSYKDGSCFYIPQEIIRYRHDIFFDGVSPWPVRHCFNNHTASIRAMSYDQNYCVTRSGKFYDEKTKLRQIRDNVLLHKLTEKIKVNGKITQIIFDKNETCVVIVSDRVDENLYYWCLHSAEDKRLTHFLCGHYGDIGKVIISDDGKLVVSAVKDKACVVVWDLVRMINRVLLCGGNYTHPIVAMAFAKNDTQLWICSGSNISLWQKSSLGDFNLLHSMYLKNNRAVICRMFINEHLNKIVIGRTDGKLNIICMHTNQDIACLEGHTKVPISAIVSNNSNLVVSATKDITNTLIIWDLLSGQCLAQLTGHSAITAVLATADMRYIVSQSWQKIFLWEIYDESKAKIIHNLYNNLNFMSYYYLYCLYKMKKNGYDVQKSKLNLLMSLPPIQGIKEFIEKYLY